MEFHHLGALLLAGCLVLPSTSAWAVTKDEEIAGLKAELASTRDELADTKQTLAKVERRLDNLETNAAGAPPAPSGPRIAPVNVDNPAISFVVDTTGQYDTHDLGWNFALRSGELFISAPVDPFLRGFATLNGSTEEGFDIEEAAVVTTALPWNLTVEGGRFFADVGRMPHWHDEALPFVNRPPSIDRLIGGESQSEGAQVTWLAPTEHYIRLTTGVFNTIGAESNEGLREMGFDGHRNFGQFTFLAHPSTYFDLTDTLNLELGGSFVTIPKQSERFLYGVDVTLRHQPGTSEFYQGLVVGTEWLWNNQKFEDVPLAIDPGTGEPILGDQHAHRNGGYAYLEAFLGRRYSVGIRGDYAEDPFGDANRQRTYSAFATWMPSEFHRLRFQFDQEDVSGGQNNQRFTLQWTAFLGSHTHGFAMR